jgi:hypothetical protein
VRLDHTLELKITAEFLLNGGISMVVFLLMLAIACGSGDVTISEGLLRTAVVRARSAR